MTIWQLFILICVLLLVMKFIGATIKLMGTAAIITVVAWFVIYVLPHYI